MAAVSRCLLLLGACAGALPAAAQKDLGGGWEEKQNEQGQHVQQLKIEAPAMTEEDQYGYVMPDRYRCDSCKAVMFHLDADLRKKQPTNRRLHEWEYTDVFDETCRTAFGGYGIKLIDGENALSGAGLPQDTKLAPGSGAIQMSSETWTKRLGELCREIVYERMSEEDVYEKFYMAYKEGAEPGLNVGVCTNELRDCTVGPKPAKKEVGDEEKPKKAGKDKQDKKDKKEKKERKEKALAAKHLKQEAAKHLKQLETEKAAAAKASDTAESIDVQTFLRNLAVSHGLTSDEYLGSRTTAEWEKLTVAMAGRIFNRFADKGDKCDAKR